MAQKVSVVLGLLVLFLSAGCGQGLRLLRYVDGDWEFTLGSKANAETEPLDPTLDDDDDYQDKMISHVEFEPELGSAPHVKAAAPIPAATVPAASSGPAPGPVRARNAAASGRSMKWWLPPSTMPSFPLFPNPGSMPGIPGLPMPGMPFRPVGGWGTVPAPPRHQPAPPVPGGNGNGNSNGPNTSGGTN